MYPVQRRHDPEHFGGSSLAHTLVRALLACLCRCTRPGTGGTAAAARLPPAERSLRSTGTRASPTTRSGTPQRHGRTPICTMRYAFRGQMTAHGSSSCSGVPKGFHHRRTLAMQITRHVLWGPVLWCVKRSPLCDVNALHEQHRRQGHATDEQPGAHHRGDCQLELDFLACACQAVVAVSRSKAGLLSRCQMSLRNRYMTQSGRACSSQVACCS